MSNNNEGGEGGEAEGGEAESNEEVQGVYIKAFCQGVSEISNVYKEHLLAIEHEYLRDRSLTIP
jgi:gamma-tubulin complex component 4